MALARIFNGQIVERRDISIDDVPIHKRSALGWLPVVYEGSGENEQVFIEPTQVRIVRSGPTKDQLRARAQQRRRVIEVGGTLIAGVHVYTDPESQAKLHAARTAAKEDANYTVKWKTSVGTFATLDATQIIALADGVRAHVQNCFAAEEAVAAKIDNNTYATYAQIDSASEWPTV